MLLRLVYDDALAQAAYLVGCQRTGEAIVIDPERDIDRYIEIARREGLRITAVAETHIHADFLSGAREFAEKGCAVYLSGEGGPDWTSNWVNRKRGGDAYNARVLRDGDTFRVGNIEFRALHTPGHTPEHMSYLLTDLGAGATDPMGVFTGDFVFVGDTGRPDLLEVAAGHEGNKEPSARTLWESIARFVEMPEFLQVWPAHGAGSACGKSLGAIPQSTVGYETRTSPALRIAREGQQQFVDFILADQPEPPAYFARMKIENRDGPALLGALPRPRRTDARGLAEFTDRDGAVIVDMRPWDEYRQGHLPNSISAPLDRSFPTVAGSYLEPRERILLIGHESQIEDATRMLVRIGLDRVEGWAPPEVLREHARGPHGQLVRIEEIDPDEARERIASGRVRVLDVRSATEHRDDGRIEGAINIAHTVLAKRLREIPRDSDILVHCKAGTRSARAASYLERKGFRTINLKGGFLAWDKAAKEHQNAIPQAKER